MSLNNNQYYRQLRESKIKYDSNFNLDNFNKWFKKNKGSNSPSNSISYSNDCDDCYCINNDTGLPIPNTTCIRKKSKKPRGKSAPVKKKSRKQPSKPRGKSAPVKKKSRKKPSKPMGKSAPVKKKSRKKPSKPMGKSTPTIRKRINTISNKRRSPQRRSTQRRSTQRRSPQRMSDLPVATMTQISPS